MSLEINTDKNALRLELLDFYLESELEDFVDYLNTLRDSGVTNMFGAPSYLRNEFGGMNPTMSRKIFVYWTMVFNETEET